MLPKGRGGRSASVLSSVRSMNESVDGSELLIGRLKSSPSPGNLSGGACC